MDRLNGGNHRIVIQCQSVRDVKRGASRSCGARQGKEGDHLSAQALHLSILIDSRNRARLKALKKSRSFRKDGT